MSIRDRQALHRERVRPLRNMAFTLPWGRDVRKSCARRESGGLTAVKGEGAAAEACANENASESAAVEGAFHVQRGQHHCASAEEADDPRHDAGGCSRKSEPGTVWSGAPLMTGSNHTRCDPTTKYERSKNALSMHV
jgi:hypothetical protein